MSLPASPVGRLPTVVALNVVSALAQVAQLGLAYPLIGLWLAGHGMGSLEIGVVTACMWAGMTAGNLLAPRWMQRIGPVPLVMISAAATVLMALLGRQVDPQGMATWVALAVLLGVATGLRWIAVESWLYAVVDGEQRGRVVGIHETLIYLAQTVGPALLGLIGVMGGEGFALTALAALLMVVPLFWARVPFPHTDEPVPRPWQVVQGMWRHLGDHLGVQLGVVGGVLDGLLLGMFAVYLVRRGASPDEAAMLMTLFNLGGVLSQVPLGWWSDRHGVRSATVVCACIGVLGVAALVAQALWPFAPLLWLGTFCMGLVAACGLTAAIIAGTQDAARDGSHMAVAVSEVSVAFTLGSVAGPLLAGAGMRWGGTQALPWLVLVHCLLLAWIVREARWSDR